MSGELRTSVVMDLRGNLERRARRYERSLQQLSTSGRRHLGSLSRVAGGLGRTLDSVGNRWVALATGAAGFGTVRSLVDLEERFTRLGIAAGQSEEKMDALRKKIFEVSRQPDIRVDPSEVTAAIEEIVERTGDLKFANENLRNIALTISATGAQGSAIGAILSEFEKMDIKKPEAVMRAIDTLNQQGKTGAFTLKDLATLGPRVVNAYTALGRTGPEAIREMGATLQLVMQGIGQPENTATAFEALLRTLQDSRKIKMLQQGGIQIFDPEQLKEGKQVLRPINELMKDIVTRVDGRASLLSSVFDAEAMRAFNRAITEFNTNGGEIPSLEKFMNVQGDGTATMKDSARAANTAAGALRNLNSAWREFSDKNLSGPIQDAADALNNLDQDTVDRWLKIGGAVAGLVGAAYAARSIGKLGADLARGGRSILKGKSTGGIAGELGSAAGKMTPVPVYVTNWGGGPGGKMTRKGGGYKPPTSSPSTRTPSRTPTPAPSPRSPRFGGMGKWGTAGAVATAGTVGWTIGNLINEHLISDSLGDKIGEAVARVLATFGNDEAQRALRANGDLGTINVKIDQDGKVREVRPEKASGGPDIDVMRGDWRAMP